MPSRNSRHDGHTSECTRTRRTDGASNSPSSIADRSTWIWRHGSLPLSARDSAWTIGQLLGVRSTLVTRDRSGLGRTTKNATSRLFHWGRHSPGQIRLPRPSCRRQRQIAEGTRHSAEDLPAAAKDHHLEVLEADAESLG